MPKLNLTSFQAHSLIKAAEALAESGGRGAYTAEEIETAEALVPALREIAGSVVDPIPVFDLDPPYRNPLTGEIEPTETYEDQMWPITSQVREQQRAQFFNDDGDVLAEERL